MNSETKFSFGRLSAPEPEKSAREVDTLTAAFGVHCRGCLLDRLMAYAISNKDTEVFGLLVGRVILTPSGRLRTVIDDYLTPSELAVSTKSFVEVSPQEIMRMDSVFEGTAKKRGFLKVGWFHTHPGHGIFMSGTDKSNHALYQHPWQVALVLDPHSQKSGFFVGPKCERVMCVLDPDVESLGADRESSRGGGNLLISAEAFPAKNDETTNVVSTPAAIEGTPHTGRTRGTGILSWLKRVFVRESVESRRNS